MSFFTKLWNEAEHEAKPLLSAAAQFAETEGLVIVRRVEAELQASGQAGLVFLFNLYVAPSLGVAMPLSSVVTGVALDLLGTVMARALAVQEHGDTLRVSVLNAGIEQAVLLAKGQTGDVRTAPPALRLPVAPATAV